MSAEGENEAYERVTKMLSAAGHAAPGKHAWRAWQRAANALLEHPAATSAEELALVACVLGLPEMCKAAAMLAAGEGLCLEGWGRLRASAGAGQTRMVEFVCAHLPSDELNAILDNGEYENALVLAVERGHSETVAWMLQYCKEVGLEHSLRAAYARGDIKMAELVATHAAQEDRVAALPAAYLTGSANVVAAATRLCHEAKVALQKCGEAVAVVSQQCGEAKMAGTLARCVHAAAQVGWSDQVWRMLATERADPAHAALGAAHGGHKALCLSMVDLCGGKVPAGALYAATLYAATAADVPAERKTERRELIEALRTRGADPEISGEAEALVVEPAVSTPEHVTPYPLSVAPLAIELALAEANCAALKAGEAPLHATQMAVAHCWNSVLRAAAPMPGATRVLAYAGLRGGHAWNDVLALATEAGAQANAEFAKLRGATPLGAVLRSAERGYLSALELLGKHCVGPMREPDVWRLAGGIAADNKQQSAFTYCAEELEGALRRVAAPLAALGPPTLPEAKAPPSGQSATEAKGGVTEGQLAALVDLISKADFCKAREALAAFTGEFSLPSHGLLAQVLCRACAAGHMTAVCHALRLGAPLTHHALVAADEAQRFEVCDMLLRFKVQIPRRHVQLLSAATQTKLCAATHIVD